MHTKNEQLIERLIQKSETGTIRWESTSIPNQYMLHLSDNHILVSRTTSMGTTRVRFTIENTDGAEVDSLSRVMTNPMTDDAILLRDIYEAARRNANRINETIDNLLSELD